MVAAGEAAVVAGIAQAVAAEEDVAEIAAEVAAAVVAAEDLSPTRVAEAGLVAEIAVAAVEEVPATARPAVPDFRSASVRLNRVQSSTQQG